jgi:hypothetical protein
LFWSFGLTSGWLSCLGLLMSPSRNSPILVHICTHTHTHTHTFTTHSLTHSRVCPVERCTGSDVNHPGHWNSSGWWCGSSSTVLAWALSSNFSTTEKKKKIHCNSRCF